jgi:microcystin-dependent protein
LIEEVDTMSSPFVAEIRIFGFNFPPVGWAFCSGQIMPISQNTALFSLLGTNYGGNGTSNFALPNLQASVPLGMGQGPGLTQYFIGETGGEVTVTLLQTEIPQHTHTVACETVGGVDTPVANVWGSGGRGKPPAYSTTQTPTANMNPLALGLAGGNAAHNNLSPYLGLTFCIALQGVFPARS